MNASTTLTTPSTVELICSSPDASVRVDEARRYEQQRQAEQPGTVSSEEQLRAKTAYDLECLALRQFWLDRRDVPRAIAQAYDLAKTLLHTIELTRSPNGPQFLVAGMAEGAKHKADLALATDRNVVEAYRVKFMEGHEWSEAAEQDAEAIHQFGVAVGHLSPGSELGAGEGSHIMVATIAFIRVLSPTLD